MQQTTDKKQYITVSPRLLRPKTRGPFDLYLLREGTYVLYNTRDATITRKKLDDLQESNTTNLFIAETAANHYQLYIREHIADIIGDENIPLHERARVWATTAALLGKEMFENNLSGSAFDKRCKRFVSLIQETAGFLQSPQSLKELSAFISKGHESYHHGVSTMVYAISLMYEFKDDDYEILACGMAAMLHDIGKMALPKELTHKDPELLTEDEFAMMAVHPMVSVRICGAFNLPPATTNAILFHHEREDGRGYPTQATGDQLTLHAKIVALCDRYDNLIRTQPYRKGLLPFEALKKISDDIGAVDKGVLTRFIQMLAKAEIA